MSEDTKKESVFAEAKEEAVSLSQSAWSALAWAIYISVIEGIIHQILSAWEKYITHAAFPSFVYHVVEYAGIGVLLVYIGTRVWMHMIEMYVDTTLKTRRSLKKLTPEPTHPLPIQNEPPLKNVVDSDHNESDHDN